MGALGYESRHDRLVGVLHGQESVIVLCVVDEPPPVRVRVQGVCAWCCALFRNVRHSSVRYIQLYHMIVRLNHIIIRLNHITVRLIHTVVRLNHTAHGTHGLL